jgi:hypothetical protein
MADTYKAKTTVSAAIEAMDDNEEVSSAWRVVTDALYEEQDRARKAEATVEAYRTAISDLMAKRR